MVPQVISYCVTVGKVIEVSLGRKRKAHSLLNSSHDVVFLAQNIVCIYEQTKSKEDKHTLSPWTKTGSERKSDNILNTAAP